MKSNFLKLCLAGLCAWAGLTGIFSAAAASAPNSSIPYVPTRHDTVQDLLWLGSVTTNDVVYDLGSGDGRVVIAAVRDFHARRAVGLELNWELVQQSRSNAVAAGVADRVEFIHDNLFTHDCSEASVVVLYLGHLPNLDVRAPIFRMLKPGSRVVSHQFGMGEWVKDKTLEVRTPVLGMYGEMWNEFRTNSNVPDYDDSRSRRTHDTLSAWIVPARVAGVWRGKVPTDSGERELTLTLHQQLSGVSGSFRLEGPTNLHGSVEADLWGDYLRCWCHAANGSWHSSQMWVDGRVQGDTLTGGVRMWRGTNRVEIPWTAHRAPADYTGTWEAQVPWTFRVEQKIETREGRSVAIYEIVPGASNGPVRFCLQREGGRLTATYADPNREKSPWRDETKPVPVFDLYDFGGGFYFTLLLGNEGTSYQRGSRRAGLQDGWLVGEAILVNGTLEGSVAFYPYTDRWGLSSDGSQSPDKRPARFSGRSEWRPKRVAP